MNENLWTHVGIAGSILIPILLAWLDLRRTNHRNHVDNQVRLGKIETMLEPLWDWWNIRKKDQN